MTPAKYFGNSSAIIDWNSIIKEVDSLGANYSQCGGPTQWWRRKSNNYTPAYSKEVNDLVDTWDACNFNYDFIIVDEWFLDLDHEICKQFSKFVNATPELVYISRIMPGHGIPLHWDIDDQENKLLAKGKVRRFSTFISEPDFGHFFVIKDLNIYNQEQGSVWEWAHYRDEHIGTNFGLTPKYLFNFLGIDNS